jgi:L-alanine-DL-glutamate epimerase-like enolase superfamily enzyme
MPMRPASDRGHVGREAPPRSPHRAGPGRGRGSAGGQDRVRDLEAAAFTIPTDRPEADGTLSWEATTLVLVEVESEAGVRGLGFTYCAPAAVGVIRETLKAAVVGRRLEEHTASWVAMVAAVRNMGRPGIAACAISAVDVALWDLRARAEGRPLFELLGPGRRAVPIYGSGGFTSYDERELAEQLGGWVERGIGRVKMKIGVDRGSRPDLDLRRARIARRAIGPEAQLFVDANGAYTATQAVALAARLQDEAGIVYFEEPVSSDHREQLAFVRGRTSVDVAAGEYGYDPWYFRDLLRAEAVDVLQADASRCLGITGWLQAADLAHAFGVPFSAHTAPSLHVHAACAAKQISHLEYFHTHVRIERMVFEGAVEPRGGELAPDPGRPGLGLEPKRADLEAYRVA